MKISEVIAWVIVGGIVLLFFIGRKKRAIASAATVSPVLTPSHPLMCSTSGDIICGVGTISAGVTEPAIHPLPPIHIMPPIHPTFCFVCRAPVPLRILNPAPIAVKPIVPVSLRPVYYGAPHYRGY